MSTFPINPNIPAANNDPADDQPLMQTNFANINQYVQIDHTNPANVGAGQHKQVTFNANNVPAMAPFTPPVLFTNNDSASLAQLFYYTGSAASSQNQYNITGVAGSTASGGSVLLLGGIILKWGYLASASDNVTVPFSTLSGAAFPNGCYAVYPAIFKNNTSNPVNVTVAAFDKNGFTLRVYFQGGGGTTSQSMLYLAVGN